MKVSTTIKTLRRHAATLAFAPALLLGAGSVQAGIADRLFDFTDAFYQQNGVNPANIDGRRQAVLPLATTDTPPVSSENNTRALLTLPAYGASGEAEFFTVLGGGDTTLFTSEAARLNAEKYREFLFPKAGTDPVGLGAFRQDTVLDTRGGYWSNDKLGLWLHTWVAYTPAAFNTKDGKKALADLAKKNGADLDGTPIITSASDIDGLAAKGFVTLTNRPMNDKLRYAVCPTVKDPRNGGIAKDQFLAYTRKADGTPLEPDFVTQFNSLQATGQEAK